MTATVVIVFGLVYLGDTVAPVAGRACCNSASLDSARFGLEAGLQIQPDG